MTAVRTEFSFAQELGLKQSVANFANMMAGGESQITDLKEYIKN